MSQMRRSDTTTRNRSTFIEGDRISGSTNGTRCLRLGDLRELVAATERYPDDARVVRDGSHEIQWLRVEASEEQP